MAYSAALLVNNSYSCSGIVARDYQTVSGSQMESGFNLLQDILSDKNIESGLIPFYKEYSLTGVIGQEKYFIPGLILDETLTFQLGDVRFPVKSSSRDQYFGCGRIGFNSLMINYRFERTLNGSNLYLFPFPDSTYPLNILGKFALSQLNTPDDDLSLVYEYAYINYMKYKLTQRICDFNTISMSPDAREELKNFESKLKTMNPIDFTVQISSTLDSRPSPSWAFVNLDGYWTP